MQLLDGTLVLSPSDLTAHLACEHLTELNRLVVLGELERVRRHDPHAELVARHGDEHEARLLAALGADVVEIARPRDRSLAALRERADETRAAMRAGAPTIFQATFWDGRRRGHADFLERVDGLETAFGGHGYEVVDAKLARGAKPAHVLGLCEYSRQVERLQGVAPRRAHLVLGDGRRETFALRELAAVHRRAAARLEAVLAGPPRDTYPEPVAHCQVCDWYPRCAAQRRRDDHLSLVADARRVQREKLVAGGLPTVRALATAAPAPPPPKLRAESFTTLRVQAELQLETRARADGTLARRDLRPPEPGRGYARLPEPSPGDVFFDLEGDPFVDGGLEYLWGFSVLGDDGSTPEYRALWAHDRAAERAAFERFVDLVSERRRTHPGLHVFHYAHHEESTLKRLAAHHGTREDAVDGLLRDGVLVDLYAVLRQAMQVGAESYSIKAMEPLYGFRRSEASVREGGGSIVAYEAWIASGDDAILRELADYNRDDCESTRALRDWLLECRAAALAEGVALLPAAPEEPRPAPVWWPEHERRLAALAAGLPADPADDGPDHRERRLLAALVDHHRREAKPAWWRYFDLVERTSDELLDESDAIGGLRLVAGAPVEELGNGSRAYWLTYPQQEHRLGAGTVVDPLTKRAAGTILELDDAARRLRLKRTKALADVPLPTALLGPKPLPTDAQRAALWAVADAVLAGDRARFRAVRSLLRREHPGAPGAPLLAGEATDAAVGELVARLGETHLAVQGPPGSGKTYLGARLIVRLLAERGWRIGVAAQSHKAIHNLLREVEAVAVERGVAFDGFHKCTGPGTEYDSAHGLVTSRNSNPRAVHPDRQLVAGTAYLFPRADFRDGAPLDLLVIDEAGQIALADAVAMGTAAKRLVLLGDPQQLPQVTQASHPLGSGRSVLEHLLDGAPVVAPDRGVFLRRTRRMHPEIAAFVSDAFYAGELAATPECARRRIDAPGGLTGAGLRFLRVEHRGNAQAAPEEADAIAAACAALLAGGSVTDARGATRALVPDDVLVVAPYNLAVRCLESRVPRGVRVGTVDRFQGQEAPVVFWAMTSSEGEDVPRGLDFLFSLNRLNVAISRAQCLAVLVASPRLLDAQARTVEQLRLLNAAALLADRARPHAG